MKRATFSELIIWLPIVIALGYVAVLGWIGIVRNLVVPQPRNPWEAISTVEGWRTMTGLPLHDNSNMGPVTQVYGALAPMALAGFMRIVGISNQAGRLLSLSAALGLIALLVAVAARVRRWDVALTGAVLFLGLDSHTHAYFVENRPDLLMLLFGCAALLLLAYGYEQKNWVLYIFGIGAFLCAFFLKQNAASIALIAALAILADNSAGWRTRVVWAAFPLLALVMVLAGLAIFFPNIYAYMVLLHVQYKIYWAVFLSSIFGLIGFFPLFVLLFWDWLHAPTAREWRAPRWRWTLAAIVILLPQCALALAEEGGASNSALPILFALTLFSVLCLPIEYARLRDPQLKWQQRFVWSVALALAILFSFPAAHLSLGYVPAYDDYNAVIAQAHALNATLLSSPEDPTIALYAQGTFSQSIYAEYDLLGYPGGITPRVAHELARASAVVDVKDWALDLVRPYDLEARGFVPIQEWEHYTLWMRKP